MDPVPLTGLSWLASVGEFVLSPAVTWGVRVGWYPERPYLTHRWRGVGMGKGVCEAGRDGGKQRLTVLRTQ